VQVEKQLQFLLNLHTGTAVPSQPAHRNYSSFSTCTPELQFLLNLHTGTAVLSQPAHRNCRFLLNLHTGRSLTQNNTTDAVLIPFDLLMMSTVLLETCRGL